MTQTVFDCFTKLLQVYLFLITTYIVALLQKLIKSYLIPAETGIN